MRLFFIFIGFLLLSFSSLFADEENKTCEQVYTEKVDEVTKEYKRTLFESFKWHNSQEAKAEVSTYDFRIYKCNLEAICKFTENWIFWNTSGKIKLKNVWCPESSYNIAEFSICRESESDKVKKIAAACQKLIGVAKSEMKTKTVSRFRTYSEKSKNDALSAKLYWLNNRMRVLADNMNNLKVYLHKIIDWIFCKKS